jgi:uncharacterized membrane protein YheB (UPF0754 family)
MNASLLIPPVLGAFIGYMTNYVAIRMLFRPLRPWKLFGIRVPMTPGVIPARREDLARNIGEMVGSHLLSGTEVAKALHEDRFQNELQRIIDDRVVHFLQKRLGPVQSLVPEKFHSYFERGIKIVRWRLLKNLHNYISGTDFTDRLQFHISEQLHSFLDREVDQLISPDKRNTIYQVIEKGLLRFGSSESTRAWIEAILQEKINGIIDEDKSLADVLPEQFQQLILDVLEEQAPVLLEKGAHLLHEPVVRQKLVATLCRGVDSFIASLGPIGAMAAGFLSREKIERTINEYLENNEDEISSWLAEEQLKQRVAQLLRQGGEKVLNIPITRLPLQVDKEQTGDIVADISRQFVTMLLDPAVLQKLSLKLNESLENQSGRIFIDVLEEFWDKDELDGFINLVSKEAVSILHSPGVKKMVDTLVVELLEEKIMARPIGRLEDFLPEEVRKGISSSIREFVNELLVREIPSVVDSLDIRQLVTRKVNSLDLLQLEHLLLGIMQEQFKYINIFGAFLGFLIGCLNLLFLQM